MCGLCPDTGVMTTQGCKECPREEVIKPVRNIAIVIATIAFLIFWVWFSWTPFFPAIARYFNSVVNISWDNPDQFGKFVNGFSFVMAKVNYLKDKAVRIKLPQYFKIYVGFFQVTSSFLAFQVKWPTTLLNALMWLKATINFSFLSLPGLSCLWRTITYRTKLQVYTIGPLILVALLATPVCVAFIRMKMQVRVRRERAAELKQRYGATLDRFWNGVMFICFMLYPMLSLVTLEPFNCQPAGLGLLAADYREKCPGIFSFERVWGYFFIILYPFGIPASMFFVLRSMGVHRLAKEKIDAALVASMINLYIKQTSSVASQKIAQLIGPVCDDRSEFKRRVQALYKILWPESQCASEADSDQRDIIGLKIGSRQLKVRLLGAYELPKLDQLGSGGPFCSISLDKQRERTSAYRGNMYPSWKDEEFLFAINPYGPGDRQITDSNLILNVEVKYLDTMQNETLIGKTSISGSDVRRIITAAPGDQERFDVNVPCHSTLDAENYFSSGCSMCPSKAGSKDKKSSEQRQNFQLRMQLESVESIVAGAEISMLKEFAAKYDINQVQT